LEHILNNNAERPTDDIKQKRESLFTEIDKYTYKKQWNKLPSIHKIIKIKEYIKETYGESELQDEIIIALNKYAEEGKINTKKNVIYDPNAEKILSIPILMVDKNKNTFSIKI
jgi:hypothetical protein